MTNNMNVPIFPLQMVLFPTIATSMRIFEQRYLRMVREAMASQSPFGVVPITTGREVGATPEIYSWGTLVEISDFDQLPDGLLGISVVGRQRLHVLDTQIEDDGLMTADVEVFPEDPDEAIGFAEDDLVDMLESLAVHMGVDTATFMAGLNKATLAWRLAGVLPVQPELKMLLLAMDDVETRLLEVKKWVIELRMRRGAKNKQADR